MEPLFFLGFGATLVPVALLILALVVILGGRREPDPEHQRPPATYYALVQFLAIFVALFALFAVASSLLNLTTDDDGGSVRRAYNRAVVELDQEEDGSFARLERSYGSDEDDEDASNAVRAAVVLIIAGGIYLIHERRRPAFPVGSPGRRVWITGLYATCFVAMLTAAAAFVAALFSGWEAAAPGVTNSGPRSEGLRDMGSAVVLAVGALLIFWRHLRWAEPPTRAAAPPGFALPPQPPAPPPPARPQRPLEPGTRPSRPRPQTAKRPAPRKKSTS